MSLRTGRERPRPRVLSVARRLTGTDFARGTERRSPTSPTRHFWPALAVRARPGTCLACGECWVVAQIFNLPYRRIVFGGASDRSHASAFPNAWQSATLGYGGIQQSTTLRHNAAPNTYWAGGRRSGGSVQKRPGALGA